MLYLCLIFYFIKNFHMLYWCKDRKNVIRDTKFLQIKGFFFFCKGGWGEGGVWRWIFYFWGLGLKRKWSLIILLTIYLLVVSCYLFVVFNQKICAFIIFLSFFWWSIEFLQQNTNQSGAEIGDKKLSLELYLNTFSCSKW